MSPKKSPSPISLDLPSIDVPNVRAMLGGPVLPLAAALDPDQGGNRKQAFLDFVARFPSFISCFIPEVHPKDSEGNDIKRAVLHLWEANYDQIRQLQSSGYGAYFTVNGFVQKRDATNDLLPPERTGDNLLFANGHYVDIDCPKEWKTALKAGTMSAMDFETKLADFKRDSFASLTDPSHPVRSQFPYLPNLVVETKNGLHAIWLYDEPLDVTGATEERRAQFASTYAEIQRSLITLFNGDPGAKDLSRVLRLPFTWHLKNPSNPFPCLPVFWRMGESDKGIPFKSFREALKTETLPNIPPASSDDQTKTFVLEMRKANSSLPELTDSEFEDVDREVRRRLPKRERASILALSSKSGIPEGTRSEALIRVAAAWREDGMSFEQTLGEFNHYNGLRPSEIRSIIHSAFKHSYSFGWNDPIIQSYLTNRERAEVAGMFIEVIKEKRQAKRAESRPRATTEQKEPEPSTPAEKLAPLIEAKNEVAVTHAGNRLDLSREAQKLFFKHFELELPKHYPTIKYLEGLGWYRKKSPLYEPIDSADDIRDLIYRAMDENGLDDFRTASNVTTKEECWRSLPEARIPKSKIEPLPPPGSDRDLLPVKNGILDLRLRRISPFPADEAWLTCSDATYDPDATCPRWTQFIKEITGGAEDKALFLQEIAGYCLTSSNALHKAFVFLGNGRNGKSVFTKIIGDVLGKTMRDNLTLEDFQKEFELYTLENKRLNVIDEIDDNYFKSSVFKRVVSGSEISANRKYKTSRKFTPHVKILFTVNTFPRINDTSLAVYERLEFVGFNEKFIGKDQDPQLVSKLTVELPGILNWCLDGLARLYEAREFTWTEERVEMKERFKIINSPTMEFLMSRTEVATVDLDKKTWSVNLDNLFSAYSDFCYQSKYQVKSRGTFQRELESIHYSKLAHIRVEQHGRNIIVTGVRLPSLPSMP